MFPATRVMPPATLGNRGSQRSSAFSRVRPDSGRSNNVGTRGSIRTAGSNWNSFAKAGQERQRVEQKQVQEQQRFSRGTLKILEDSKSEQNSATTPATRQKHGQEQQKLQKQQQQRTPEEAAR